MERVVRKSVKPVGHHRFRGDVIVLCAPMTPFVFVSWRLTVNVIGGPIDPESRGCETDEDDISIVSFGHWLPQLID